MKKLILLASLLLLASPASALMLEDGKGTGNRAEVNKENQLVVSAITVSELEHESEENGQGYNWTTDIVDPAAGAATVLLLKNTSDTPLHIETVLIANGSTVSEYTIHLPTSEVTLTGGATVTGTNLNTASSNVADASAQSNETNNVQGNVIYDVFLLVDTTIEIDTPGLILGKNKSIGVDVVTDVSESSVTIVGHFAD